jgi:uncharacterized protein (DUF58 family)
MNPDHSRLAAVRARLDLPTSKRASGLLEGVHRSLFKGHGQDFDDMQLYVPGDDVTDIDWMASARTGAPVIRRYVRDTQLTVVLVVDTGRQMAATAAGGRPKSQVAAESCAIVAAVAHGRGDVIRLVAGDSERLQRHPPSDSTAEIEVLLRSIDPLFSPDAPPSDLSTPLESVLTALTRHSLVVIVTDETRPEPELSRLLGRLRVRHEVMVIGVRDLSPISPTGEWVEDVDGSTPLPPYLPNKGQIEQVIAQATAQRRRDVADVLRHHAIPHLLVADGSEVPRALAKLNQGQRYGRR